MGNRGGEPVDRYSSRMGKSLGEWRGKLKAVKAGVTHERAGSTYV